MLFVNSSSAPKQSQLLRLARPVRLIFLRSTYLHYSGSLPPPSRGLDALRERVEQVRLRRSPVTVSRTMATSSSSGSASGSGSVAPTATPKRARNLPWIEKFRPRTFDEIVGNKGDRQYIQWNTAKWITLGTRQMVPLHRAAIHVSAGSVIDT